MIDSVFIDTNILKQDRAAMFGCLLGKYIASDDFDSPLDDFKEYMA